MVIVARIIQNIMANLPKRMPVGRWTTSSAHVKLRLAFMEDWQTAYHGTISHNLLALKILDVLQK